MAQALDDLLDSLEDPDDATREEAAKALAQLANPTTLDALIGACGDEYWSVRTRAGWGVAKIGGPKAMEALIAFAQGSYQSARQHLARLGGPVRRAARAQQGHQGVGNQRGRNAVRTLQQGHPAYAVWPAPGRACTLDQ